MESRALEDEWAVARLKDTAPASLASPSTSAPSQNHKINSIGTDRVLPMVSDLRAVR